MVSVELVRKADGALLSCSATGHAGFAAKGADIVCAAVTAVLRTTLASLSASEAEKAAVACDGSKRGSLVFRVEETGSCPKGRLVYAADFLQKGLEMIAAEYPQCVKIRVEIEK